MSPAWRTTKSASIFFDCYLISESVHQIQQARLSFVTILDTQLVGNA
jgi:hypothetical protein